MAVFLKSPHEVEQLRKAACIVAETFDQLSSQIRAGVSTIELDQRAEAFIRSKGARPMYKGYTPPGHRPFPATICVAVNNQVVHGIPNAHQILHDGDIIGVDIGVMYNGWVGDGCRTYAVGTLDAESRRLLETTERCLDLGIAESRAGNHLGDVGAAVQRHAESQGFSVVRELFGHGIGKSLWEEPSVAHYGRPGTGLALKEGMVFTIEPMINAGSREIRIEADGWTITTADGSRSAQFEDMIAITQNGPRVLTRP